MKLLLKLLELEITSKAATKGIADCAATTRVLPTMHRPNHEFQIEVEGQFKLEESVRRSSSLNIITRQNYRNYQYSSLTM